MDYKISLIVSTLGHREKELKRLFDSLVLQNYKNFEVVIVIQDNYDDVENLCKTYKNEFSYNLIFSERKGLSIARNLAMDNACGDIFILSDDDCWYPDNAMKDINNEFKSNKNIDVLTTKIYDPITDCPYKNYAETPNKIDKAIKLLSKSSIEIAFRKDVGVKFDEDFGLGAKYVSGEENDFLVRVLKLKKNIYYKPITTVYHEKKKTSETVKQLEAKGAFYCKNFGFFISNLVLLRDLIIKKQNNYKGFWNGYKDYKKHNK